MFCRIPGHENKFRIGFKTFGERNKALKILNRAGFDYELVEDLRPFVAKAIQVEQILTPAQELNSLHGDTRLEDIPHEGPGGCGGGRKDGCGDGSRGFRFPG